MALGTITKVSDFTVSNKRFRVRDIQVTSGANYVAGGESVTPSQVNLRKIEAAIPLGPSVNSTPLAFTTQYNHATNKLVAYGTNATPGAAVGDPQVTAGTDLSGYSVRYLFIGF